MARISPSQVTSTAVDGSGLSVTVAPRRADDSRYGALYDATSLAAAALVHLHPLTTSEYLMVFSRYWHTGTLSETDPGAYTDHTEVVGPGWVRVSVPTGQRTAVGSSHAIPLQFAYDSATLVDAVSRSNDYLYLLTAATRDAVTSAVVSHWWYNTTTGSVTEVAEEVMPTALHLPEEYTDLSWAALSSDQRQALGSTVTFDRGLWFHSPHLMVFGADADGVLFLARKPWSRIGYNKVQAPGETMRGLTGTTAEDPRWTFWTGDGWSVESHLARPVTDRLGHPLTSAGPVSVATFRDRALLATVAAVGDVRVAQIYTQRGFRGWDPTGMVSLGSVADGSYLGPLRWQQQVSPAASSVEVSNDLNEAAMPYVVNTLQVVEQPVPGGSPQGTAPVVFSTLRNDWALWPIVRPVSARVQGTGVGVDFAVAVGVSAAAEVTVADDTL